MGLLGQEGAGVSAGVDEETDKLRGVNSKLQTSNAKAIPFGV
jgi:hypothetical protein